METGSIISALGGGSGVDMVAIANQLADAQFQPRVDRLTVRSETLDRQISAAGSLKNLITQLSGALGDRVRSGDLSPQATIANATVATVRSTTTARPAGSYLLEVTSLASSQTLASPAMAGPLGAGTLTLRFGIVADSTFTPDATRDPLAITIAAGATLADVAASINAQGAGVSAYVANSATGARLVLKGSEGAANGFVLETAGDPGLSALGWEPAAGDPARLLAGAGDATFKIDGIDYRSASNRIDNAVPGLSLSLLATNVGAPTRISFTDPAANVTSAMGDLVAALNEITAELRAATDPVSGDLARDSGARALRRALSGLGGTVIMPSAPAGAPATLADLGLAIERDGSFRLDSRRLTETLARDATGAAAMFTPGLYGVFATIDRIARAANVIGNPGSLAGSISRYTNQKVQISEDQAKLSDQQERFRAQMVRRFAGTESRIGASRATLSFLQNQVKLWTADRN